ncbi:hypothetical protein [Nocardioides immobilis]|nr:hypothetical protein [Nocardioides immobilis]
MSVIARPAAAGPTTTPALLAFAPLVACVAGVVAGTALADDVHVEDIVDAIGLAGFPLVGGLLLLRGKVPVLARIFCLVGVLLGAGFLAGAYADSDLPGAPVGELLAAVTFVATIQTLLTVLPLLFPTGHLPSRRWRVVAWAVGFLYPLTAAPVLLMSGPVDDDDATSPDNPIGLGGAGDLLEALELATLLMFAVLVLTCLASLLLRLRGAQPGTRRQIGILGAGVGVLAGLFLLDSTLQGIFGDVYGILAAVVATTAVPIAAAIALLPDRD